MVSTARKYDYISRLEPPDSIYSAGTNRGTATMKNRKTLVLVTILAVVIASAVVLAQAAVPNATPFADRSVHQAADRTANWNAERATKQGISSAFYRVVTQTEDEEKGIPETGGVSRGDVALLGLGVGALIAGGGLLAFRIFRRR
jgi:hypothetical protein